VRSGGNSFNYFSENKLTKLANFVQFKRMLMFCLEDWGLGPLPPLSLCLRHWWREANKWTDRRTNRRTDSGNVLSQLLRDQAINERSATFKGY